MIAKLSLGLYSLSEDMGEGGGGYFSDAYLTANPVHVVWEGYQKAIIYSS